MQGIAILLETRMGNGCAKQVVGKGMKAGTLFPKIPVHAHVNTPCGRNIPSALFGFSLHRCIERQRKMM